MGVVEIRIESVNRHDHPVGVAAVTTLNGRFRRSNDGIFREYDDLIPEAGEFRVHSKSYPLHFLVSYIISVSY